MKAAIIALVGVAVAASNGAQTAAAVRVRYDDADVAFAAEAASAPAPGEAEGLGWNPMEGRADVRAAAPSAAAFSMDDLEDNAAAAGSFRFASAEPLQLNGDDDEKKADDTGDAGDKKDATDSEYGAKTGEYSGSSDPSQPSGSDYQGDAGSGDYQGDYQGGDSDYQGEYGGAAGTSDPAAPGGKPLAGDEKGTDDADAPSVEPTDAEKDESQKEAEKNAAGEEQNGGSATTSATGATGARGPAGPAGPAGPQGPAGPAGEGASISADEIHKLEKRVNELEYLGAEVQEVAKAVFPTWATESAACPDGWQNLGYKEDEARVHCEPPEDKHNLGNTACDGVAKFPRSYDRCGWSTHCRVRWNKYGCYKAGATTEAPEADKNQVTKEEAAEAKAATGQTASEDQIEEARKLRDEILGKDGSAQKTSADAGATKPAPSLVELADAVRPAAFVAPAIPAAPKMPEPFDHERLAKLGR